MFRPTGFADLAGKRVGVWGYGVEGRATSARLRDLADAVLVDDVVSDEGVLVTSEGGFEALLGCDVVLKSPGIARRRADVVDLERRGVVVTSALNLWLHDAERSRVLAVTGTKGKSTTTALAAFFLHCLGERAQHLGNIGQPPYDPSLDTSTGWVVLEVSSFQCVDLDVAPGVIVVTSLGEDHVDWHGSLEQYRADKLSLTRARGAHRTLVADAPIFHELSEQLGGMLRYVDADTSDLTDSLGLLGSHNRSNVALALAGVEALTGVPGEELRAAVAARASEFEPLRARLTLVATQRVGAHEIRYVDDALATSVLPTVAALATFDGEALALIVGGFDRGVDYGPLARVLVQRSPRPKVIAMGDAGRRLAAALTDIEPDFTCDVAITMDDAVHRARTSLTHGGVVLLSPAAPSFDLYRNWQERSDDFTGIVRELVARA